MPKEGITIQELFSDIGISFEAILQSGDALLTPWRIQKWVQVQDSERGRNRGTLPSSQHFEG